MRTEINPPGSEVPGTEVTPTPNETTLLGILFRSVGAGIVVTAPFYLCKPPNVEPIAWGNGELTGYLAVFTGITIATLVVQATKRLEGAKKPPAVED